MLADPKQEKSWFVCVIETGEVSTPQADMRKLMNVAMASKSCFVNSCEGIHTCHPLYANSGLCSFLVAIGVQATGVRIQLNLCLD